MPRASSRSSARLVFSSPRARSSSADAPASPSIRRWTWPSISASATSRDCAPSWRSRSSRRRSASPACTSRARDARSSSSRARSSASSRATWLRSRPARKANGSSAVAMNARPLQGVAPARGAGRDEQEREQPADVDRRELEPLERRRPPPAQSQPHEHDDEQGDVERGLQRRTRRRRDPDRAGRAAGCPGSRRSSARAAPRTAAQAPTATVKMRYPASTIARSRPDAIRPDGKVIRSWRNTPPQRPPATSANVYTSGGFAKLSAGTHHAKPSSTISAPGAALRPDARGVQPGADEAPDHDRPEHRPGDLGVLAVAGEHQRRPWPRRHRSAARTMARIRPAVIGGSSPDRRAQASRAATRCGCCALAARPRARQNAQNG